MSTRETRVPFRPRARLLSLLGEQLISDQAVGLIELVKNAYDADATHVQVALENLSDPETTRIVIEDDGFGMTRFDLEDKWLSPAVDHKERKKQARERTLRGRLPIGEKGVGRFAVHQLGRELKLITRAENAPEVVLRVNWDEFDSGEDFLDDLTVSIIERDGEVFQGSTTGTILIIEKARANWTENLVKKVQRSLRRLQSPHVDMQDFTISFSCPDFPSLESIDPSDITDRWHYRFRGTVDENGFLDYEYQSRLPSIPERRVDNDNLNLAPSAISELSGLMPICGRFSLNFYVWDRSAEYLRESDVSRHDLDVMAGVALFRDGLRVLPYGESGNDWLDLDKERINDPSKRIGNQQIIGFVEIQQVDTPDLRDKTNREGLIENDAFRDLRALVRAAVNVFTTQWLRDRPGKKIQKPSAPPDALKQARNVATAVASSARDDVVVNLGSDYHKPLLGVPSNTSDNHRDYQQQPPLLPPDEPSPYVTQREAVSILMDHIRDAEEHEKQTLSEQEQREEILMHLAATGMVSERVAHEFGRQIRAALDALSDLRTIVRSNEQASELFNVLDTCLGTLRNEFRVLAPYDVNWRLQRTSKVEISDALELAVKLNEQILTEAAIEVMVKGDDFEITARPASLVQVFDNLLHNAAMWLTTVNGQKRLIGIQINAEDRTVLITDNGPGVPEHMRDQIFEAFVTMRNGGRGLGLYITQELLNAMKASISLIDPPSWANVEGAAFLIQFPDEAE